MTLKQQIEDNYHLHNVGIKDLQTPANDNFDVSSADGRFALKVYNYQSRSFRDVQWEMELIAHLISKEVPVAKPVQGRDGYIHNLDFGGKKRAAVLYEWANGEKPKPNLDTYVLLGNAAAQIHSAADSFHSSIPREKYDMNELLDEQLKRMKEKLVEAEVLGQVEELTYRLKKKIAGNTLDWGVCHNDLTLDNVHRDGDTMTVFDFDSAAECWRASEPWLVFRASEERFKAWLEGYRMVRNFSSKDEDAVAVFSIICDIRNVAWKLGLARSSRGKPLLETSDLPGVVEEWQSWEHKYLS